MDVIRATTTAVTSVALGRRCFPAVSVEDAEQLRERLGDALLAGELGGERPSSFELHNSPTQLLGRADVQRPLVLLSTSGTQLMRAVEGAEAAYVACMRNSSAAAELLARTGHEWVDLIGASSRGEFREEDQLCCAWIGARLVAAGYEVGDERTAQLVDRWRGAPPDAMLSSSSVEYLRRTEQLADLEFVLSHVDDVQTAFTITSGEVVALG